MRVDINGTRKRLHQMKCPEAERIGHFPDIRYTLGDVWLSFDYIIFIHTIEDQ